VKYLVLSVITLVILIFFVATAEFDRMLSSFTSLRVSFLMPAIGIYFLSLLFRTLRWKMLLSNFQGISPYNLFQAVCIGYMVNNILPMRIGEFVRAYFLGTKHNISKTTVLVTVFVERILDAVVLIGFLLVIISLNAQTLLTGLTQQYLTLGFSILIGVFLIMFVLMVYSAHNPVLIKKTTTVLTILAPAKLKDKLIDFSDLVESGLTAVKSPKSLLLLFLASLPVWISEITVFCIIGYAMGFMQFHDFNYVELFSSMTLVTSLANLVSSIPSAPGGVGIFELTAREVVVFNTGGSIDRSVGSAFALLVHGILIIPVTILGQLLLWSNNLSLRKLVAVNRD